MNVIGHPAYGQRRRFAVLADSGHVRPEMFPNIRDDEGLAVLRAENAMDEIARVGMPHVPSLRDSDHGQLTQDLRPGLTNSAAPRLGSTHPVPFREAKKFLRFPQPHARLIPSESQTRGSTSSLKSIF